MADVPAGWYPDPTGSGELRWWDGSNWTDQRQAGPAADGGSEPVEPVGPGATFGSVQWPGSSGGLGSAPPTTPGLAEPTPFGGPVGAGGPGAADEPGEPGGEHAPPFAWMSDPATPVVAPPAPPEPEQKKGVSAGVWVAIGAVALLVIALLIVVLGGGSSNESAKGPTTTTTLNLTPGTGGSGSSAPSSSTTTTAAPSTTLPGLDYTDGVALFRIRIGPNWEPVVAPGAIATWTLPSATSASQDNVSVNREQLASSDVTIDDFVTARLDQLRATPGITVQSSKAVDLPNGQRGFEVTTLNETLGAPMVQRQVIAVKRGNAIIATVSTAPDRADTVLPAIEPYLLTLNAL